MVWSFYLSATKSTESRIRNIAIEAPSESIWKAADGAWWCLVTSTSCCSAHSSLNMRD
jgi:hypothetical protein